MLISWAWISRRHLDVMASGGITHFVNKVKSTAISLAGEVQPVLKVSAIAFVFVFESSSVWRPIDDAHAFRNRVLYSQVNNRTYVVVLFSSFLRPFPEMLRLQGYSSMDCRLVRYAKVPTNGEVVHFGGCASRMSEIMHK